MNVCTKVASVDDDWANHTFFLVYFSIAVSANAWAPPEELEIVNVAI